VPLAPPNASLAPPPPPPPWAQQSCPAVRACEPAATCPYSASISPLLSGLLLGALLGIGFERHRRRRRAAVAQAAPAEKPRTLADMKATSAPRKAASFVPSTALGGGERAEARARAAAALSEDDWGGFESAEAPSFDAAPPPPPPPPPPPKPSTPPARRQADALDALWESAKRSGGAGKL
jgi:hypothetical protein